MFEYENYGGKWQNFLLYLNKWSEVIYLIIFYVTNKKYGGINQINKLFLNCIYCSKFYFIHNLNSVNINSF